MRVLVLSFICITGLAVPTLGAEKESKAEPRVDGVQSSPALDVGCAMT